MTKVRVHELAKTLNKSNKEVIDFLRESGVEVSSHMSSLEDAHVELVTKKFAPAPEKPEPVEEPKKKHIVQVFRPQNSRQAGNTLSPNSGRTHTLRD